MPPNPDLHAIVTEDSVAITDAEGYELVNWTVDEVEENPALATTIARSVTLAYEDPDELIQSLWGPGEWPHVKSLRDTPAWKPEVESKRSERR